MSALKEKVVRTLNDNDDWDGRFRLKNIPQISMMIMVLSYIPFAWCYHRLRGLFR